MARQLRFQYPGAVYHVMARGDGGKQLFLGKEDHESFLHWLGQVCGSHGWRVHAWVLMGNHFHLLLETPEANLSAGMRVLRKRGPQRRMIFLAGPGRGGDSGGRYDRSAFTPLLLSPPRAWP
jgi:REP element-mobilizing transposase RayT